MKKEMGRIGIIFFIIVGLVLFGLNYIFLNQKGPRSKAAGETIYLTFNPPDFHIGANTDMPFTILAKPSINTILRGYKTKINFDNTKFQFKSIQYKTGVVSAGLGDTNADITAINTRGFVNVIGEDQTATGYVLGTANGAELATITFTTTLVVGGTSPRSTITATDSEFYSINSDTSLFNGWIIAAQNLDINGGSLITCQSFSDDFSSGATSDDGLHLWTNGAGSLSIGSGILTINLPLSTDVGARMAFAEANKPLNKDFSSEITLISRNNVSTYEYFQFNDRHYDGTGVNGFGFRLLNGSLKTEVYGVDNPTNPGAQDHGVTVSKDTPVKLKLEKIGTTVKMYYDLMGGQGYQLLRTFDNFNTNSGYVIVGVQHTGSTNLQINGSFDNYNQTCLNITPTPTQKPTVIPTSTPTPTPTPPGNVHLKMKLKFQGINKLPAAGQNSMVVKVKLKIEGTNNSPDDLVVPGTFIANDQGIWSGTVNFGINDISGRKWVVYIKGPQHIQKKICNNVPTETAGPGLYRCSTGNIILTLGDNNLDFSGILLLTGDLDQSGIVDSVDFGLVRNNLGKTDATILAKSDLNRDGRVDTQDFALIIAALGIRTDEQ